MLLLILFAVVAGAATAASPCALPILPVVLAAGATGGRRRPLGLATGLVVSFTFATVGLVYLINALGLPSNTLRIVAIVVLGGFGAVLLIPPLAARVEAAISRLGLARGARMRTGDGFGSGFGVGLALGAVYAPCAGPILAGIITVSAAQSLTVERLVLAAAYGTGAAVVLFALALGVRWLSRGLRRVGGRLPQVMGVLMVLMALAMATNADTRFQTALADHLPAALVDPAHGLESSTGVQQDLANLRGDGAVASAQARLATTQADRLLRAGKALPRVRQAPDFVGGQRWFNTPRDRPLHLSDLHGHVVLVDFWTYSCINCVRTFPFLRSLYDRYRSSGLRIVGVHTPEFPFERNPGNVANAITQNHLTYPVVQDNVARIWGAYKNSSWPGTYLIDPRGEIRRVHFGEGEYALEEQSIRSLLAANGTLRSGERRASPVTAPSNGQLTPEIYFGAQKGFLATGPAQAGVRTYPLTSTSTPNLPTLTGRWKIGSYTATPVRPAAVQLDFTARRVFMVAGGTGGVHVTLDGRSRQTATVKRQTLYPLVDLPGVGNHHLTLRVPRGVHLYTFTFG